MSVLDSVGIILYVIGLMVIFLILTFQSNIENIIQFPKSEVLGGKKTHTHHTTSASVTNPFISQYQNFPLAQILKNVLVKQSCSCQPGYSPHHKTEIVRDNEVKITVCLRSSQKYRKV